MYHDFKISHSVCVGYPIQIFLNLLQCSQNDIRDATAQLMVVRVLNTTLYTVNRLRWLLEKYQALQSKLCHAGWWLATSPTSPSHASFPSPYWLSTSSIESNLVYSRTQWWFTFNVNGIYHYKHMNLYIHLGGLAPDGCADFWSMVGTVGCRAAAPSLPTTSSCSSTLLLRVNTLPYTIHSYYEVIIIPKLSYKTSNLVK